MEEEEEVGELWERIGDDSCESCRGERCPADDPRKGNSTERWTDNMWHTIECMNKVTDADMDSIIIKHW